MIGLHNIDKQFGTAFPYRFPGIVKYLLFSLCVSCCLSCKVRRTRSFVIFWSHGVVRSFIHKNFLTPPPKITNVIFKLKFWFWRILREREKEKNGSHCLASFAFVHYVVDDKRFHFVDNDKRFHFVRFVNDCRQWWHYGFFRMTTTKQMSTMMNDHLSYHRESFARSSYHQKYQTGTFFFFWSSLSYHLTKQSTDDKKVNTK